jgi:hypothetical protein
MTAKTTTTATLFEAALTVRKAWIRREPGTYEEVASCSCTGRPPKRSDALIAANECGVAGSCPCPFVSGDVDQLNGEAVARSVLKDIDVEHEVAPTLLLGPKVDQTPPAVAVPQGN